MYEKEGNSPNIFGAKVIVYSITLMEIRVKLISPQNISGDLVTNQHGIILMNNWKWTARVVGEKKHLYCCLSPFKPNDT